jgi:LPXTG-site transpeptidase (sortase) family protein
MMAIRASTAHLRAGQRAVNLPALLRIGGSVLLSIAVLIGGFVAYELWVTSFLADRAQAGLGRDLDERIATVAVGRKPYEPAPLEAPPFEPAPIEPDVAPAPPETGATPVPEDDPSDIAGPAILVTEPRPAHGEVLGRLVVPSAGVDWVVVEGVNRAYLRSGAGHMPDTAMPGQPGNTVISGHRTTYGAPFYHLDRAAVGDLITFQSAIGTNVYEVIETLIVGPTDVWVTDQWEGSWLTLTTCHPRFAATERLVVIARLIEGPNADILGMS